MLLHLGLCRQNLLDLSKASVSDLFPGPEWPTCAKNLSALCADSKFGSPAGPVSGWHNIWMRRCSAAPVSCFVQETKNCTYCTTKKRSPASSRIRKLFTLIVDVGNPISMSISSSVSAKTKACSSIEKSIILLYNFILVIFYCSVFWNCGTNQLLLLPRILQHLQWLQKGLHAEHLSARRPLVAILGPQKRPNDIFRSQ